MVRELGTLESLRRDLPAGDRRDVTLVAPSDAILIREAVLPLAIERDLDAALDFEMDRLTPFEPGEVFRHTTLIRRDRTEGTLRLRLAILPRQAVTPMIEALAATGLAAGQIEARVDGANIRFAVDGVRPRRRRLDTGLAALCGILAVACMAIPPVRQQITWNALAAHQRALVPQLHEAEALRHRLAAARAGAATLAAARARGGSGLTALAAITNALPDGSFLTGLQLHRRVATLDGESPDAAGLVTRLSGNPDFAAPEFAAPVTRALDNNADVFSIKVRISHNADH
jgi:general secretion pathway protein L